MSFLDVTFRTTTPAYAGAAEFDHTDGLRPPTVRYLLRFWWRALHPALSSDALFAREEALFGSTRVGQRLRILPRTNLKPPDAQTRPVGEPVNDSVPCHYLAYGAVTYDANYGQQVNRLVRTDPGYAATYRLVLPSRVSNGKTGQTRAATAWEQYRWKVELEAALWLLSAAGGYGARSRRGYGALMAQPLTLTTYLYATLNFAAENWDIARQKLQRGMVTLPALASALDAWEAERPGEIPTAPEIMNAVLTQAQSLPPIRLPEFAALGQGLRLLLGRAPGGGFYDSWLAALDAAGDDFLRYRRSLGWYGNNPVTGHLRAATSPGTDHQWRDNLQFMTASAAAANAPLPAAKAAHFGLPLNGRMSSGRQVDLTVDGAGANRRASPVFFSVLCWGEYKYTPVILYLPSRFLPGSAFLKVKVSQGGALLWDEPASDPGDTAVQTFFNAMAGPNRVVTNYGFPFHRWEQVAG